MVAIMRRHLVAVISHHKLNSPPSSNLASPSITDYLLHHITCYNNNYRFAIPSLLQLFHVIVTIMWKLKHNMQVIHMLISKV